MSIDIIQLGMIDYDESLNLQKRLFDLKQAKLVNDILLLLEHPPVITFGRRANVNNVLATRQQLETAGIKTYFTDRGGDVTYHGPGQIIGYTIFDLDNHEKDIRAFVRKLESVFVQLLDSRYKISASSNASYPGVWVQDEKILSIGLSIKHYITMHGFAFNVNTNLDHFSLIVPCGIKGKEVTSLSRQLGYTLDLSIVAEQTAQEFCKVFDAECIVYGKNRISEMNLLNTS